MAETALRLPKVKLSPSTLLHNRHKLRESPFYQSRFSMTKEQWEETLAAPWFKKTDALMPVYPYGRNAHFPEANYGLYGGATIMSGNKISDGRNKGKTLRKWFPNIRVEKIRSQALDKELTIPIRARVMRTIRKCGGLDEYLLGEKAGRIKELGVLGWKLRWMVMQSPRMQEKFAKERASYGLPNKDPTTETFEEIWNNERRREQLINQQDEAWEKLRAKMRKFEQHVESKWDTSDKPESPYKDYIQKMSGTLTERLPSKMELPKRIRELSIKDVSEPKLKEAEI